MSNMKRLIENGHYYEVKAIAPTQYQRRALSRFNLNINEVGSGSFIGTAMFETIEDAKQFLRDRAELYYDEYPGQVDEHLDAIEGIDCLTIDTVTAHIEKIEIDDNE